MKILLLLIPIIFIGCKTPFDNKPCYDDRLIGTWSRSEGSTKDQYIFNEYNKCEHISIISNRKEIYDLEWKTIDGVLLVKLDDSESALWISKDYTYIDDNNITIDSNNFYNQ